MSLQDLQVTQPALMQMPMEKKVRASLSKNPLAKRSGIRRNRMKKPINAPQQIVRRCQLRVRERRLRQHRTDREQREPSQITFFSACVEAISKTNQLLSNK